MHKYSPFRALSGAAIALYLVLGGCAQITETLQDASDGLSGLLGEAGAKSSSGTGPTTAGPATARTATGQRQEKVYQAALAARAKGAQPEAYKTFRSAAEGGHAAAAYEVGLALLHGTGVEANRSRGMKWMDTAAARGEARAQYFMAQAYYDGQSLEPNPVKAAAFLTDAAMQGHAEAQYALGEAYSAGRGVPKNAPWAARWYGKAAHRGMIEAQYAYGLVHTRGLGLPVDRTEGYRWLLLAALAGHERAEVVRKAMQTKMAPEMVALAEVWVERFRPRREAAFTDRPTVQYVQQVLNELGYDAGPVDGQPGKRTIGAVGAYQKKLGQKRNGRITPGLVDRLLAEQAKAP